MTKLFASDFDGTLCMHDGELTSERNLDAIRAYQAEGGLFGVCTGRPLRGLTRQTGRGIPFDFYIAATGSAIYDADWNCLWRVDVPRDAVRELTDALHGLSYALDQIFFVADDDYWIITDRDVWELVHHIDSFESLRGPFTGLGVETVTIERAEEAAAFIQEHFAGVFDAYVNLASIDVVPAGCSKGTGLRRAAELFGADLTAGIGDSFNDLPLLEAADVAYTFPTVDASVQAAADALVPDVAAALEDFALR